MTPEDRQLALTLAAAAKLDAQRHLYVVADMVVSLGARSATLSLNAVTRRDSSAGRRSKKWRWANDVRYRVSGEVVTL